MTYTPEPRTYRPASFYQATPIHDQLVRDMQRRQRPPFFPSRLDALIFALVCVIAALALILAAVS